MSVCFYRSPVENKNLKHSIDDIKLTGDDEKLLEPLKK